MKTLEEINLMIDGANQVWKEIRSMMGDIKESGLNYLATKKEELKNLLEDIRQNIEASLNSNDLVRCKKFLETILGISENLRVSYVSPGYMESYYIMDTLKTIGD